MIEERKLHEEGEGRVTYLDKRINQINKMYSGDEIIKEGIKATEKTAKELQEQYIADKLKSEQKGENEEHRAMLNEFQL